MDLKNFKCKYCSDSGCSEGDYHDEQLVIAAKKEVFDDIEKENAKMENKIVYKGFAKVLNSSIDIQVYIGENK